jgi:hypothetical protein
LNIEEKSNCLEIGLACSFFFHSSFFLVGGTVGFELRALYTCRMAQAIFFALVIFQVES